MICHTGERRPAPNNRHPHNFKTKLCKQFAATGRCGYGQKCQFAHGLDDLQSKGTNKQRPRSQPPVPISHPPCSLRPLAPSISHPPCSPPPQALCMRPSAPSISCPPCSPRPQPLCMRPSAPSISYPAAPISYPPVSYATELSMLAHSPYSPRPPSSPRSPTPISPQISTPHPSYLVGIAYYQPPLPPAKGGQLFSKTNMPDEPTAEDILEHLNIALENMQM